MREYATYGKRIMKNIKNSLLKYKGKHNLTNAEMAQKCDISISEYDKIMNIKRHSDYGCTVDTLKKICLNLDISSDFLLEINNSK